jgi:hypothetical protein
VDADFRFGFSRSIWWDAFNLLFEVMAWLVAAGALLLLLAVGAAVEVGRWSLDRLRR